MHGAVVNLTATPQAHHEFTGWSGDLNGATINDNQLTVPMDQGRQITASFARLDYDLDVISAHGISSPAVGTHSLPSESVQTVALAAGEIINGLTRHQALGWRGTGSLADGNDTSTGPFALNAPTSITWLWNTNYFLEINTSGSGSIDAFSDWHAPGSQIVLTATPTAHNSFNGWSGDLAGTTINGNQITIPMNLGRRITGTFTGNDYTLEVISPHGSSTPPVGENHFPALSTQMVSLAANLVTNGMQRHQARGWIGTGSVGNGTGSSTGPFVLTQPSSITWLWDTNYFLDVSTTGNGSLNINDGWHLPGTPIRITATPAMHHQFSGWSGNLSGADIDGNQIDVVMDRGRGMNASFSRRNYDLTISSPRGTGHPAVGTHSLAAESMVTASISPAQISEGTTRHSVLGYSGTGSAPSGLGTDTGAFILNSSSSLTWNWQTEYFLTLSTSGIGSLNRESAWHVQGDVVQVQATPVAHHSLSWAGDLDSVTISGNSLSIPLDQARSIQAVYTRNTYTLEVNSPHGHTTPAIGTHQVQAAAPVQVILNTPVITQDDIRFVSTGWEGSGVFGSGTGSATSTESFTENSSITWNWETNYLLTVRVGEGGSASTRTDWHLAGSSVIVDAIPDPHWEFAGWSGDINSSAVAGTRITLSMNTPRNLTANFVRRQYAFTILTPVGETIPAGTGLYESESVVSARVATALVTTGGTRHRVRGWEGSGSIDDGAGEQTGPFTLSEDTMVDWLWETEFHLTAMAETGGTVSGSTGWFSNGAVTVLTAHPGAEALHAGWSGDVAGTTANGNQLTVPMDRPRNITARFTENPYELTVESAFGTASPGVGVHVYPAAQTLNASVSPTVIAAGPDSRHVVQGWTGFGSIGNGSGSQTGIFEIDQPSRITWVWQAEHWLSIDTGTGGNVSAVSQWVAEGERVDLVATPDPHFAFAGWSGDIDGANPLTTQLTLTVDAPHAVTARFERLQWPVTVNAAPGESTPSAGVYPVNAGSDFQVRLNATTVLDGDTRWLSTGWKGGGNFGDGEGPKAGPVTITQPSSVTWTWRSQHRLRVENTTGGTVIGNSGWYDDRSILQLEAQADPGFEFVRWTGDTSGGTLNGSRITLTMDQPRSVTAEFRALEYTVTVHSERGQSSPTAGVHPMAHGTVVAPEMLETQIVEGLTRYIEPIYSASAPLTLVRDLDIDWRWTTQHWVEVEAGSNGNVNLETGWFDAGPLTLTATPDTHFRFVQWSDGDSSATRQVQVDAPTSLQAEFEVKRTPAGVPHPWLAGHSVTISDEADDDEDGVNNADEWQADTDPSDADNFPRITYCGFEGPNEVLEWPSRPGILYRIEVADDLSGPYRPLVIDHKATPPLNRLSIEATSSVGRYFRLISQRE